MQIENLVNALDQHSYMSMSTAEWLTCLSDECQVYQLDNGGYIAKSFSQINYMFCDVDTAKTILIDNLHVILRNKYFKLITDEVLEKISSIVSKMTMNLRSVLKTVTFNKHNCVDNSYLTYVQYIPDYCVAFRNGVYDFKNAKWLFEYNRIPLTTGLTLIAYPIDYIVRWYFNFDFTPLDIKLSDFSLQMFIDALRDLNNVQRNYCFELAYNIAHDTNDKFDINRFEHLCQILGYTCLNSFAQYFVLFIGAGQNGKNSLFDGCFTTHVIPKPAANDLESIETDKFITGSLEGVAHNIFLETSAKTYRESKMIKSLTGSSDQTIEHKNVNKYSGTINCKFIFAGNYRNEIKFADTTNGFIRRINLYNVYYTWDKDKTFMQRGDYYDCSFSSDLHELKDDLMCTIIFIYLAMYGIMSATEKFNKTFTFTHNEWTTEFANIDEDLKRRIERIRLSELLDWARESDENASKLKNALYATNKHALWREIIDDETNEQKFKSFNAFLNHTKRITDEISLNDEFVYDVDEFISTFHEMYLSIGFLKEYINNALSSRAFSSALQQIYGSNCIGRASANVAIIRCKFKNNKLQIVK